MRQNYCYTEAKIIGTPRYRKTTDDTYNFLTAWLCQTLCKLLVMGIFWCTISV